jgi:hypothetical protein
VYWLSNTFLIKVRPGVSPALPPILGCLHPL